MLMLILFWLFQTQGYRNRSFLVALYHLILKRLNLEVAYKRLLHHSKNTGEVLVSCCPWKCAPTFIFGAVDFQGPWVSFIIKDEFSKRVTKTTSVIIIWWIYSLPLFNSMKWPYCHKYIDQISLNYITL